MCFGPQKNFSSWDFSKAACTYSSYLLPTLFFVWNSARHFWKQNFLVQITGQKHFYNMFMHTATDMKRFYAFFKIFNEIDISQIAGALYCLVRFLVTERQA